MKNINRYCGIEESLETSLQQIQLIKSGNIPKKSWKEFCLEIDKEDIMEKPINIPFVIAEDKSNKFKNLKRSSKLDEILEKAKTIKIKEYVK